MQYQPLQLQNYLHSQQSRLTQVNFIVLYKHLRSVHYHNHLTTGIPSVKQNQNAVTSTVVSSLIVFILSSTLFFFIGCVCGWFGHKHKTKGSESDKNITSQAAPVYEDLQPSTFTPQDQERAFELKENVAYGPI